MSHCHGGQHGHNAIAEDHHHQGRHGLGFTELRVLSSPYQHYSPLATGTTSTTARSLSILCPVICLVFSFIVFVGGLAMLLNGVITKSQSSPSRTQSSSRTLLIVVGSVFIVFALSSCGLSLRRLKNLPGYRGYSPANTTQLMFMHNPTNAASCCSGGGYVPQGTLTHNPTGPSCCGHGQYATQAPPPGEHKSNDPAFGSGSGYPVQPSAPPIGEQPATAATAPPAYEDIVGQEY